MARLQKIVDVHQAVNRGRRARGEDYVPSLLSAMHLALFKQFAPKEIVNCALYSPKMRAELPVLISKQIVQQKASRAVSAYPWHGGLTVSAPYRICLLCR